MSVYRKLLYCVLFLVVPVACNRRPEGVLSRSTMRKVLVDLHKTDGLISVKNYRGEQKNECYQNVLMNYGISQAQFDSSIVWYSSKPKIFEKIYIDVLEDLQTENDFWAHILQQQKAQENMQRPELAFLDSLIPQILTQTPDSQRIYLDILLGNYQKPKQEPFPMRSIYKIQLQDSIFKALQDTARQKHPKAGIEKTSQRGFIKKKEMQPKEMVAK